jgi:molybdopterin molybdotransferase
MLRGVDPEEETPLTPVEVYLDRVLTLVRPLDPVRISIADAWGRVPIADVIAPFDLPTFRSSAMDGYAVRAHDVAQAPVSLVLVGEVLMGRPAGVSVGPGEAVAVPTGGVVPDGADAVVPIELTERAGDRVTVLRPHGPGKYVRPAGEDVRAGDVLVAACRPLAAPDVGALAAAGIDAVRVCARPRVGVVSTGDELVRPPAQLADAQVYDANAYTLMAAVREAGAEPVDGGTVRDDPAALMAVLDGLAADVDAIVCSGGVSMGVHDPVKRAFEDGGDVAFFNVGMQPGRPQASGTWRGTPFVGLPGNPVSVFVSFEVFVRPAIAKMAGAGAHRSPIDAVLDGELDAPRTRARYARVRVRREGATFVATPEGGHRSNLLATSARSDGLAVIPAGARIANGQACRVILVRDVDR